jgi:hypothetical protein
MDRSRILRFRVTPDEGAEVDRRAQSRGQSLSQYLRAAALDGVVFHDEASKAVTTGIQLPDTPYRCPTALCLFETASPAAVCPIHGRKVTAKQVQNAS